MIYNHNTIVDIEKAFYKEEISEVQSINNVVSEGIISYIKVIM